MLITEFNITALHKNWYRQWPVHLVRFCNTMLTVNASSNWCKLMKSRVGLTCLKVVETLQVNRSLINFFFVLIFFVVLITEFNITALHKNWYRQWPVHLVHFCNTMLIVNASSNQCKLMKSRVGLTCLKVVETLQVNRSLINFFFILIFFLVLITEFNITALHIKIDIGSDQCTWFTSVILCWLSIQVQINASQWRVG